MGLGEGVVLVEPDTQSWTYKTRRPTNVMEGRRPKTVQVEVDVARTQIRLFPAEVLTTNACQGQTLDPLVAHQVVKSTNVDQHSLEVCYLEV